MRETDAGLADTSPEHLRHISGALAQIEDAAARIRRRAEYLASGEPEGGPSDAQVDAALCAFFDGNRDFMSDPRNVADMRAALRAAGEAEEDPRSGQDFDWGHVD